MFVDGLRWSITGYGGLPDLFVNWGGCEFHQSLSLLVLCRLLGSSVSHSRYSKCSEFHLVSCALTASVS